MKKFENTRARIEILSWIMAFSVGKNIKGNKFTPDLKYSFIGGSFSDDPPVDSLCIMSSAPFTKYYLSWLREINDSDGESRYLLESIEDGSLCWWSNVSLWYYPTENIRGNWRWNDKQFEFNDKWLRACYKKRHAYMVLPIQAIFGKNNEVTLGTRRRWSGELGGKDFNPKKIFTNYKKVLVRDMLEFYDSCLLADREIRSKKWNAKNVKTEDT